MVQYTYLAETVDDAVNIGCCIVLPWKHHFQHYNVIGETQTKYLFGQHQITTYIIHVRIPTV